MTFDKEKYIEIGDFINKNSEKNVKIVAVSKNHSKKSVIDAIKSGVLIFGENRVQEALSKFSDIKKDNKEIELHLTGPLQSNKVKQAIEILMYSKPLTEKSLQKNLLNTLILLKIKNFLFK